MIFILKGSIVALITPFDKEGKVNFEKLEELIEFQYINETKNLLILGTTSESPTLLESEKDKLVKFIVKKNRKRMKLVVGVTSNNTKEAIKKALKYESYGADYLLVISPYYNKTNEVGLIKHFNAIADVVKIPIIIYNIPSRTGINIDVSIMKELKKHSKIIGVKEANRDISHILDVNAICDENFNLYCGNDDLLVLFLSLKSPGTFTVYGNLEPQLLNAFYNTEDINTLHNKYYQLLKTIFIETNPIPIKALMNYEGMDVGSYRLPLTNMKPENYQQLIYEYEKVKLKVE